MSAPQPAPFAATLSAIDDRTQALVCTGDLDIATAPAFKEALAQVTAERLVVNLLGLAFLDSVGIGALLTTRDRFRDARLAAVVLPDGAVARVLHLAGLAHVLHIAGSVEQALAALSTPE